jgi:hypothetical protein
MIKRINNSQNYHVVSSKGKFFSEGAVEMLKHHHTNLTFLKHLIPVYNSNITLIYVHAYKTSSL